MIRTSIGDIEVHVRDVLVGSKIAYQVGPRLFVSPAMWDLMKNAETDEEFHQILSSIKVKVLSEGIGQPLRAFSSVLIDQS